MHRLLASLQPAAVLTGCVCIVAALVCSGWRASADDLGSASPPDATGRPGILVMRNGKVVDGRILKSGDDYSVRNAQGGIMFVPGTLVSLHCDSLKDAYQKLRANAQKQNAPNGHCALARWCITNKLNSEARAELTDALDLDPQHDEARNLLVRLNELLDAPRPETGQVSVVTPASAPKPGRFDADDIESLGSLPREQALHFTRRIQPILVNNCAGAGCHGTESETGFRLQRVVAGSDTSRIASERNLAEVLAQIDVDAPRSSPLLVASRGNHGRRGRPAFPGPRGGEQLDEVRKWVQLVARSEVVRARQNSTDSKRDDRIEQASGVHHEDGRPASAPKKTRGTPADEARAGGAIRPTIDPFQVARDPFDPELFNKHVAPKIKRR